MQQKSVVAKNATTAADGKVYQVDYYSLDMIISLGYRVNSKRATRFRRWATSILKDYLIKGYALDQERLKQEKFAELEQTIEAIKQAVESRTLAEHEAKGFIEKTAKRRSMTMRWHRWHFSSPPRHRSKKRSSSGWR